MVDTMIFRALYGFGIAWLTAGIMQSNTLMIVVGSLAVCFGAHFGWKR